MDSGCVKVSRERQLTNFMMPVEIFIDEVKSGAIKPAQRNEFVLPAGWHTVQAKSWASDSTVLALEIKSESPVLLICRFKAKFDFLYAIGGFFRGDWFNLHTYDLELKEEQA